MKSLGGRPTKYRREYCKAIVDYMSEGYSKTAFAGHILVSRDVLLDWTNAHQEFREAVRIGEAARTRFLEYRLLNTDVGPRVTAAMLALKNACPAEWRDKHDVRVAGEDGGPVKTVTKIIFSGVLADGDETV